jgi:hypothetical protein
VSRPLDRRKTLDELEPPAWSEPDFQTDTGLVIQCHRLRRKPIGEFSVEDLRLMIGQSIGLPWLVPLALEVLERDPLVEATFYPGDLLRSLLRVEPAFWSREWEWRDRLIAVLQRLTEVPEELKEVFEAFQSHTPRVAQQGLKPQSKPRSRGY